MYTNKNQQITYAFNQLRYPQRYVAEQQVKQLVHQIHSLQPSVAQFVNNNGAAESLFKLEGTIPITYQFKQYNIPVCVWLPTQFPMAPPRCFVTPTQGMKIKPQHILVDTQGVVYHPYLSNWNFNNGSTLSGLVGILCSEFGKNPPVYSGGPISPQSQIHSGYVKPQPRPQPQPQPQPQPWGQPPINKTFDNPVQSSFLPNQPLSNVSNVLSNPNPNKPNLSSVSSGNTKSEFESKIKKPLQDVYDSLNKDMKTLAKKQSEVEEHRTKINVVHENVIKEKEALIQRKEDLASKIQFLEKWLEENESKEEIDIEKMIIPSDLWSQQAMDATAFDLASTDMLLELDKALDDGTIKLNQYIKQIRKVARDQFLHRALSKAVFKKQDHIIKQSGRNRG